MIQQLTDWQLRALQRAPKMRLDPALVNEAIGILSTVFGDAWLIEANERHRGHPVPFRRHPIGDLLGPPGESQVAGLLELIEYLKFAARSAAFSTLVDGLKAQYRSTFLQLAFGFRLARAGATQLDFEPPVQGGRRGDISCNIGDRPNVVECYVPRVEPHSLEADWLLEKCMGLRTGIGPTVLSIGIKLKKPLGAAERKGTLRLVREFCQAIDANVLAGRYADDSRYAETEAAHISVARTLAVGPGQNSLGRQHVHFPNLQGRQPSMLGRVGVTRARDVRNDEVLIGGHPTRDCVAIWLSDEEEAGQSLNRDLDGPIDLLGQKLERKLQQTRVDALTGRVLIVNTWITGQLHRVREETMARFRSRLFDRHAGVAGVLLVLRGYGQVRQRHRYDIACLVPEGTVALPAGFLGALKRLEGEAIPALS